MPFHLGQKVASVKNASKVGVVLELGEINAAGVQWVRVRFSKGGGRWTLEDGIRPYQASKSIPVPDGVVVLVRPGHAPEVFQQPGSKATWAECEQFLYAVQSMYLLHGRKTTTQEKV
jgi:hypothetical protein